jgi:hypothetical protein
MSCGCIKRQAWLVKTLCKHGMTKLCQRAKERLAKMEGKS